MKVRLAGSLLIGASLIVLGFQNCAPAQFSGPDMANLGKAVDGQYAQGETPDIIEPAPVTSEPLPPQVQIPEAELPKDPQPPKDHVVVVPPMPPMASPILPGEPNPSTPPSLPPIVSEPKTPDLPSIPKVPREPSSPPACIAKDRMVVKHEGGFPMTECPDDRTKSCVVICHVPPGNPEAAHTIIVGESALKAHLAHSTDRLGDCAKVPDVVAPVQDMVCLDKHDHTMKSPDAPRGPSSSPTDRPEKKECDKEGSDRPAAKPPVADKEQPEATTTKSPVTQPAKEPVKRTRK